MTPVPALESLAPRPRSIEVALGSIEVGPRSLAPVPVSIKARPDPKCSCLGPWRSCLGPQNPSLEQCPCLSPQQPPGSIKAKLETLGFAPSSIEGGPVSLEVGSSPRCSSLGP